MIFLIFIIIPILEITIFITVGSNIGVLNTIAIILITHNVHHAYPVGNSFTVLNRGKSLGTFNKTHISREELLGMMAGGEELDKLEVELEEMNRINN